MSKTLVASLTVRHGDRVMRALRIAGTAGLTDFELATALDTYLSSINAARNTLMKRGQVKRSGMSRPSGRGGMATVWVAA